MLKSLWGEANSKAAVVPCWVPMVGALVGMGVNVEIGPGVGSDVRPSVGPEVNPKAHSRFIGDFNFHGSPSTVSPHPVRASDKTFNSLF